MKLMTKELEKKLPRLYETENVPAEEKEVIAKYFCDFNGWRWYAVEYDPEGRVFFGYIDGDFGEWGYFSLDEFEEVNKDYGMQVIKRDLLFKQTKFKDLQQELNADRW